MAAIKLSTPLFVVAALICTSGLAFGDITQDFSTTTISGGPLNQPWEAFSQYSLGNVYEINSMPAGWSVTGGGALAFANDSDQVLGILLNENATAILTLSGLTEGQTYTATFDYFGDNRPVGFIQPISKEVATGQYSFNVTGGSTTVAVNNTEPVLSDYTYTGTNGNTDFDVTGVPGTYNTGTITFVADSSNTTLTFTNTTTNPPSEASAIISYVDVVAAPEPSAIVLLAAMLLGVGITFRRALRRA